jgi:mycofactocin precursor peptide peptidase
VDPAHTRVGRVTTKRLGDATWTDLDASVDPPILLVPIGSCEQHGPHLPLDTDTRIATAVATAVAERMTGVLIAPSITVTASGEHQGFPGTLSIGSAATEMILVELVRSADWASGMVFINGHGGNLESVERAVVTSTTEGRRVLSWWPRFRDGDAHAGRTETSMMLVIAPHLVRLEAAAPGDTRPIGEVLDALRVGGVRSVSRNGVLGDPTGASADEGNALLDALVTDAIDRISAWRASSTR